TVISSVSRSLYSSGIPTVRPPRDKPFKWSYLRVWSSFLLLPKVSSTNSKLFFLQGQADLPGLIHPKVLNRVVLKWVYHLIPRFLLSPTAAVFPPVPPPDMPPSPESKPDGLEVSIPLIFYCYASFYPQQLMYPPQCLWSYDYGHA
ncbi:unnamed protein product, partial [Laminaria digitata]